MAATKAMLRNVVFVLWLVCCATAGLAEPYRLIAGDVVQISLIGVPQPADLRVDIDGQIRLIDVGTVNVANLTLDEAEAAIEASIVKAGLFVDPKASVSVRDYAPVVVAGDVAAPGRIEYLSQMTVATALGLSGGRQVLGTSRLEIDRARAEVEGQLKTLNQEITETAIQIARFQAELSETDAPALSPDLRAVIPAPFAARIEVLLDYEAQILANSRARAGELLALWEQEIAALNEQRALLEQRLVVQTEIATSFAHDLEATRDLLQRGLQTGARLSRAEQVDAEARDRVLEIEAAKVSISRLITESNLERTRFLRSKREDALTALRAARVSLDDEVLRHARALEQLAILTGGNVAGLIASDGFDVRFSILSPRPGRGSDLAVTSETVVLPGDTLVVQVDLSPGGG